MDNEQNLCLKIFSALIFGEPDRYNHGVSIQTNGDGTSFLMVNRNIELSSEEADILFSLLRKNAEMVNQNRRRPPSYSYYARPKNFREYLQPQEETVQ